MNDRDLRICQQTGFGLARASGQEAWRIARDQYVRSAGINGVLLNDHVGPLPDDAGEHRGRYDTVGRTVYFADTPTTAFAEVLQAFRVDVVSTKKDADAVGLDVDTYLRQVRSEAHACATAGPGEIPIDWQMSRSLYRVAMPQDGWWVIADSPHTLNALSDHHRHRGQLSMADVCGSNRALTTELAQLVRESMLDDGHLPLGIEFLSKTAYGRCWAWWNRRADDNLNPGPNEPRLVGDTNVNVPEFHRICDDWDLLPTGSA